MSKELKRVKFDASQICRAFGRGVRTVRKQKKIRQTDIQRATGVTATTVGVIEQGRVNASLASAVAIAYCLNTPVDRLIRIGLEEEKKCQGQTGARP